MIPENTDTPLKADCPSTSCSALDYLAQELDIPAEHIREAARAMREKKITEAAKDLHAAFFVMRHDWNDGDFDLPPLARIHMEAMECKAIELGKLLFQQNDKRLASADENLNNHEK